MTEQEMMQESYAKLSKVFGRHSHGMFWKYAHKTCFGKKWGIKGVWEACKEGLPTEKNYCIVYLNQCYQEWVAKQERQGYDDIAKTFVEEL